MGQNGASLPPLNKQKGWEFKPDQCEVFTVPSMYPSLRLWGRTGCDEQFKCQTGNCVVNGDGSCVSAGDVASLVEGTLQDNCDAAAGKA